MKIYLAIAALVAAAGSASADVVAYWNFNNSTQNSTSSQLGVLNSTAPNQGSGTLSIGGGSPTVQFNTNAAGTATGEVGTFSGNTLNALGGDLAGGALSFTASIGAVANNPVTANGAYVQFGLDMSIYQSLVVSFATRGTSTGFRSGQLSYSGDGVTFTDFGPTWDGGASSTFFLVSRDLSAITSLNGDSSVFIRLTLNGATGGGGNNRIDNVQFNATLVPTPGSLALVGLGGLVATRRRR